MKWECVDDIRCQPYKEFIGKIRKSMNRGFPEFYKRWLVENQDTCPEEIPCGICDDVDDCILVENADES